MERARSREKPSIPAGSVSLIAMSCLKRYARLRLTDEEIQLVDIEAGLLITVAGQLEHSEAIFASKSRYPIP